MDMSSCWLLLWFRGVTVRKDSQCFPPLAACSGFSNAVEAGSHKVGCFQVWSILNYYCMTNSFLGRYNTHICSPYIGIPQQTKVANTIKADFGGPRVWLGLQLMCHLQEQIWLKDSYITKACPSMGDHSQKPRAWSALHNLQVAQQVRESVVSDSGQTSSRQLGWSPLVVGSWSGLRVPFSFCSSSLLYSLAC